MLELLSDLCPEIRYLHIFLVFKQQYRDVIKFNHEKYFSNVEVVDLDISHDLLDETILNRKDLANHQLFFEYFSSYILYMIKTAKTIKMNGANDSFLSYVDSNMERVAPKILEFYYSANNTINNLPNILEKYFNCKVYTIQDIENKRISIETIHNFTDSTKDTQVIISIFYDTNDPQLKLELLIQASDYVMKILSKDD